MFFIVAVQQLPPDSVESNRSQTPKGSALSLNLHHWINSEIVRLSVYLPLLYPLTGSWEGWACPSSLWAKGMGTCQLVSGQIITSNVNFESPIRLPPNACLWTVAGSQSSQVTQTCRLEQRRICDLGPSDCEVTVLTSAPAPLGWSI